jgi:hypothetical protein
VGTPSQSPAHPGTDTSSAKDSYMGIPLKGWAGFAISLIVVCAALAHYTIVTWGEFKEQEIKINSVITDNTKLTTENKVSTPAYADATHRTNAITAEMAKHTNDTTGQRVVVHHDSTGDTIATYFASDGCIALARPGPTLPYMEHAGDVVRWFLGPSVKVASSLPQTSAGPAENRALNANLLHSPSALATSPAMPPAITLISNSSRTSSKPRLRTIKAAVPQDCVNPHPGKFDSKWGPANGCVAALTRTWADGCSHYQEYNSCTGKWDPQIHWTVCNPGQHH